MSENITHMLCCGYVLQVPQCIAHAVNNVTWKKEIFNECFKLKNKVFTRTRSTEARMVVVQCTTNRLVRLGSNEFCQIQRQKIKFECQTNQHDVKSWKEPTKCDQRENEVLVTLKPFKNGEVAQTYFCQQLNLVTNYDTLSA